MYFAVVNNRTPKGWQEETWRATTAFSLAAACAIFLQQRFQLILIGAGMATEQEQQLNTASGKILVAKRQ